MFSSTGDVLITAPFKHRVAAAKTEVTPEKQPPKREHPLVRALKWQQMLKDNPELTARALAKQVHVSETTMSMTLQLLGLAAPIQEKLLFISGQPIAYHLGLRTLAKMAALPLEKQKVEFASLLSRWQGTPKPKSAAIKL